VRQFYLLYVCEGKEIDLANKYGGLCPTRTILKYPKHRKSNKPVKVEVAAFPAYTFIPCDNLGNALLALKDKFVYYVVKFSDDFSKVSERELGSSKPVEQPKKQYSVGDEVIILLGDCQIKGTYAGNNKAEVFLFDRNIFVSI